MKAPFQLDALIAVVVILSLAICRAQEMSVGHCPDVTVKQDFDVTQVRYGAGTVLNES